MTRVVEQHRRSRGSALVAVAVVLLVVTAALIADAIGDSVASPPVAVPLSPTAAAPAAEATVTTSTPPSPPVASTSVTAARAGSVTTSPIESASPASAGDGHAAGARTWTWDELADCESGDWDADRNPIAGTARWDDSRGGYEGGVHFAPSTWDGYRPDGFPDAAYDATRDQQIVVAELVLDDQGPGAWPTCSYKVGMR